MEHEKYEKEKKGAGSMQYILLGVTMMLLLVSVLQAFTLNSITADLQAGGVSMKGAAVSTSAGETYEEMMARMHPDQVAAQPASAGGAGMVGGC